MEGIDRAKSRALTTINLNCFTVVVFFCVKVVTCKLPVDVRKHPAEAVACCNGGKLFLMDCCRGCQRRIGSNKSLYELVIIITN